MIDKMIQCPKCGERFSLDDALLEQVDQEINQRVLDAEKAADARAATALQERDEKHGRELERIREEAAEQANENSREQSKRLEEAEYQLGRANKELSERDEKHQRDMERARQEATEDAQKNHERQMDEANHARKRAEKALEERDEEQERAVNRAREEASEEAERKYRLDLEGKDEEIRRLGEHAAAMERQARQGSMELQGEALEVWLKQQLQVAFPVDSIEDVKKGQRGADLVQQVINPRGQRCGVVLWETKNAQNWSKGWLDKIHGDAERENADLKVIVTAALPKGINSFGLEAGVWVSNVENAPALGFVLRQQLIQLHNLRRANIGREGKMEAIYDYLVSDRFADRVNRIVGTWKALKDQIDAEERAMRRQWKERNKQLDTMIDVTTDFYTDISAVIGAEEMPQVEGLSLAALPSGEDD